MSKKSIMLTLLLVGLISSLLVLGYTFSEERQNKIMRSVQNLMGTKEGRVDVYAGQADPVKTYFMVEKLSTAIATNGNEVRPYRFGYGYRDLNKNGVLDNNEKTTKKKYFEVGNFTQYVYYDDSKD